MSLRTRSATAGIAVLALLGLPSAPPAEAHASPTATVVTVSSVKPAYGEPVTASVTVTGAQAGSLTLRVNSPDGTTLDQAFAIDAANPSVTTTLPTLAFGTNTVQAWYAATDPAAKDAASKDGVTVRVRKDTTTISTAVPSVRKGSRLVATSTVVSTHGQPVDGVVHFYLVKDDSVIVKSVFRRLVDGRARAKLGKLRPDRYLVVTRYTGSRPFTRSNTLEQHVRVKRR